MVLCFFCDKRYVLIVVCLVRMDVFNGILGFVLVNVLVIGI